MQRIVQLEDLMYSKWPPTVLGYVGWGDLRANMVHVTALDCAE